MAYALSETDIIKFEDFALCKGGLLIRSVFPIGKLQQALSLLALLLHRFLLGYWDLAALPAVRINYANNTRR
jgi:hypothetical protein